MVLIRIVMPKLERNEVSTFYLMSLVGRKSHQFPSVKLHAKPSFVTNEFRECLALLLVLPVVGLEVLNTCVCTQNILKCPNSLHFYSLGHKVDLYACSLVAA